MNCEEGYAYLKKLELQQIYNKFWEGKQIPIIGTIEITYQCNFRCIHCYADEKHNESYMSFQEIKGIVDQLEEAGTFLLTISGGDPLAHPSFSEIYQYIKQKGFFVEVFTNATLITEETIMLFKQYPPINVDITMYGASEETYERVTRVKNGYARFLRGIDLLEQNKIPFSLKASVLKENVEDLPTMQSYAKSKNVSFRYSYQIASTINGNTYNYDHRLTPEEIVMRELNDSDRKKHWEKQELAVISDVPYGELPIFNCKTAKFTFCISSDAKLSGCIHDRIRTFDLRKGLFTEGWKYINKELDSLLISPAFQCASCEYLPFCNTCPADVEREFHSINAVDPFNCEVARLRYNIIKKGGGMYEI